MMIAAVSKYTPVVRKNEGRNVTTLLYAQAALVPMAISRSMLPIRFLRAVVSAPVKPPTYNELNRRCKNEEQVIIRNWSWNNRQPSEQERRDGKQYANRCQQLKPLQFGFGLLKSHCACFTAEIPLVPSDCPSNGCGPRRLRTCRKLGLWPSIFLLSSP